MQTWANESLLWLGKVPFSKISLCSSVWLLERGMHLSASQIHQWGRTRRGFEPLTSDLHPESQPLPEAIWAGGGEQAQYEQGELPGFPWVP